MVGQFFQAQKLLYSHAHSYSFDDIHVQFDGRTKNLDKTSQ